MIQDGFIKNWMKKKYGKNIPWTPLQLCAFLGKDDFVKYLLESGSDKNIKDKVGHTAEDIAIIRGKTNSAEIIKKWRKKWIFKLNEKKKLIYDF